MLVWRVTERCDSPCPFCAFDVTLSRSRRELDGGEAVRFASLAARWSRDLLVSWLGGEPFAWPPLRTATQAIRAAGARVALTSNGRALRSAAWRAWALAELDELTLSIDGVPELHDELRGGGGAALFELLGELRAARIGGRPLLRVNTVVMRRNVDRFGELAQRVADAGADELTWNALGGNDRPEFFPANRLRPEDVATLAAQIAAAPNVRGGSAYLVRQIASARGVATPVDDCGPGRTFWFAEVDGTLSPCSFTTGSLGIPTATLGTEADLDALPDRFAALRRRRLPAACLDCPSTQVHAKWT